MKIIYLKLKNFNGIYSGLGLKEIELDFSNYSNVMVLFQGMNGSGKSTIMSTLHPFSGTFDDRSSIILEGHDGYKEIHIIDDLENYYVIQHFYGKKNKSFIQKNDVELNESGGIRTFEPIIESELGITESFFKLIKIGSNVENFIDLNATKRKQFIGEFMPSIEEYLSLYKNVNDKLNFYNKEIKFVVNEIDKIDSTLEELESTKKTLKAIITSSEKVILKHNKQLTTLEIELADNSDILKSLHIDNDFKEHKLSNEIKLDKLKKKLKEYIDDINSYIDDFNENEVEEYITSYQSLIHEKEISYEKQKGEYSSKINELNTLTDSLTSKEGQLAKFKDKSTINIEELKALKLKYINSLKALNDKVDALDVNEIIIDTINTMSISKFETDIYLYNTYIEKLNEIKIEYNTLNDPEHLLLLKFLANNNIITELNNNLDKLTDLREELNSKYAKIESSMEANKNLKEVTSKCKTTSCEVYKLKTEMSSKDSLLIEIKSEYKEVLDSIKRLKNEIATLTQIKAVYKEFKDKIDGLNSIKLYKILDNKIDEDILEFIKGKSVKINLEFDDELSYVRTINSINELQEKIINVEKEIDNYNNSYEFIKTLKDEKEVILHNISIIKATTDSIKSKLKDLNNDILYTKNIYDIMVEYKESLDKFKILETEIKDADVLLESNKSIIDDITLIQDQIKVLKTELKELEDKKATEHENLDKINVKINNIQIYEERKNNILAEKKDLTILKQALDIKTGIPLHLLGAYLEDIKTLTNTYLKLAFGDHFYIDFEITDSEFNIPVYKSGSISGDINICSQGEKALVKTSLSLAIIHNIITMNKSDNKYNIIYLDEIDSELDSNNRMIFLDILSKQLEMIKCQQCFIITHNQHFYNYDLGLILLQGANVDVDDSDFMVNKNIIADFRK